jgi:hypothetical protein
LFIKNKELDALAGLLEALQGVKKYQAQAEPLAAFVARARAQRLDDNARNWERIKEKRKARKDYARSKPKPQA